MPIKSWLRRGVSVVTLGVMGLLSGCSFSTPLSTLDPYGPLAAMKADLFWLTTVFGVGVYVLVLGILLYTLWRFRIRRGDRAAGLPKQVHGDLRLETAWTFVPVILLVIIGIPTVRGIWATEVRVQDEDALQINVTGYQWWWAFEYPELGITTANEVHIPVGRTVNFTLRSGDVIHSFWVPAMAGKRDLIPNQDNYLWFSAEVPGIYYGHCTEFCLGAHAQMRMRLIAQTEDDFNSWVASFQEAESAEPPSGTLEQQGSALFLQRGCVQCHAVAGTVAQGVIAPDLTNFGQRITLAGGTVANNPENLAAWLRDPQAVKPGNHMPNLQLSEEDISALVAYLLALGRDDAAAQRVQTLAHGGTNGNR